MTAAGSLGNPRIRTRAEVLAAKRARRGDGHTHRWRRFTRQHAKPGRRHLRDCDCGVTQVRRQDGRWRTATRFHAGQTFMRKLSAEAVQHKIQLPEGIWSRVKRAFLGR